MTIEILERRRVCKDWLSIASNIKMLRRLVEDAEEGDISAINDLCDLYNDGKYIPDDGEKTVEWFKKVAYKNLGSYLKEYRSLEEVYCNIGVIYFYGDGMPKNFNKAYRWLRKASESLDEDGSGEAMYLLGELFLRANENLKHPDIAWFTRDDEIFRDFYKAFYWFESSYDRDLYNNDIRLCRKLYPYGFGLNLNENEAFEFFLEAIKRPGQAEIMYQTAKKYFKGANTSQDDMQKVIYWLTCAAEHGHDNAICMLGDIYLKGKGVEINIERAVSWYEKLNERDYLRAMYKIGKMYRDGTILEKNFEQACRYFDKVIQNFIWENV